MNVTQNGRSWWLLEQKERKCDVQEVVGRGADFSWGWGRE
jgi:hypothetical protein